MQHVQLDRSHAVDVPLQNGKGHKVAADVDHQAAPRESWSVVDLNVGDDPSAGAGLNKLQKGLQAVHDAERAGRGQLDSGLADG